LKNFKYFLNRTQKSVGFSLVELMVVITVIGLLGAIGIPRYAKLQAKARQAEAKNLLSYFYLSEASFFLEWNQYTVHVYGRLIPSKSLTGQIQRYTVGFDQNGLGVPCTGYSVADGAPVEVATMAAIWSCAAIADNFNRFMLGANWGPMPGLGLCRSQPVLPASVITDCNSTPGAQAFRAAVVGDPNGDIVSTNSPDIWTIDNNKTIGNPVPGIL